jgi:hypothetical protein
VISLCFLLELITTMVATIAITNHQYTTGILLNIDSINLIIYALVTGTIYARSSFFLYKKFFSESKTLHLKIKS